MRYGQDDTEAATRVAGSPHPAVRAHLHLRVRDQTAGVQLPGRGDVRHHDRRGDAGRRHLGRRRQGQDR